MVRDTTRLLGISCHYCGGKSKHQRNAGIGLCLNDLRWRWQDVAVSHLVSRPDSSPIGQPAQNPCENKVQNTKAFNQGSWFISVFFGPAECPGGFPKATVELAATIGLDG